jgi:hypothetical protein
MSNFPRFYNPNRIGTLYYPDVATIAAEATSCWPEARRGGQRKCPPGHHRHAG